jgi:precorrin-8X/cobalt-precorrin-8 methylmutase
MMRKGAEIERESFDIISDGMSRKFTPEEMPIVQRVIHATGDFDFEEIIRFHPDAIERGITAIRAGKDILVDVKMVEAGINKRLLSLFGGRVLCYISDPDVETSASEKGLTRAEAAVIKAVESNEPSLPGGGSAIGIVAVGNAPTALLKVMELVDGGLFRPDLIIGVPVGFVKAEESKGVLNGKGYPFITCLGRKGGSPVAVAIVNALLKLTAQ